MARRRNKDTDINSFIEEITVTDINFFIAEIKVTVILTVIMVGMGISIPIHDDTLAELRQPWCGEAAGRGVCRQGEGVEESKGEGESKQAGGKGLEGGGGRSKQWKQRVWRGKAMLAQTQLQICARSR